MSNEDYEGYDDGLGDVEGVSVTFEDAKVLSVLSGMPLPKIEHLENRTLVIEKMAQDLLFDMMLQFQGLPLSDENITKLTDALRGHFNVMRDYVPFTEPFATHIYEQIKTRLPSYLKGQKLYGNTHMVFDICPFIPQVKIQ